MKSTPAQRARRKRYYWAHREKALQQAYAWRKNNPDRSLEISRNWRSANLDKFKRQSRKYNQRRYAIKKSRIHPDIDQYQEMLLFIECQRLTKETGVIHHLDHIIPLTKGGWHHHLNLQPLPASVNHSKRNNPLWSRDGYKSWRDVPEFLWPDGLKEIYKKHLTP